MANTYLTVPFKDKDAAKGLGAKWDAAQRQWYVPDGRELTPFQCGYRQVLRRLQIQKRSSRFWTNPES
jgi:hypothetical protein